MIVSKFTDSARWSPVCVKPLLSLCNRLCVRGGLFGDLDAFLIYYFLIFSILQLKSLKTKPLGTRPTWSYAHQLDRAIERILSLDWICKIAFLLESRACGWRSRRIDATFTLDFGLCHCHWNPLESIEIQPLEGSNWNRAAEVQRLKPSVWMSEHSSGEQTKTLWWTQLIVFLTWTSWTEGELRLVGCPKA